MITIKVHFIAMCRSTPLSRPKPHQFNSFGAIWILENFFFVWPEKSIDGGDCSAMIRYSINIPDDSKLESIDAKHWLYVASDFTSIRKRSENWEVAIRWIKVQWIVFHWNRWTPFTQLQPSAQLSPLGRSPSLIKRSSRLFDSFTILFELQMESFRISIFPNVMRCIGWGGGGLEKGG